VKERSEAIERQKIQDEENERMKNRENEIRKQYDEEQRQKKFEEDQKQFEEEQRQKQFEEEQRQKQFEEEQRQKQFEEEQRQKQAEAFQKQLEKEEREREERNQREQENREKEEEKQRLKVEKEELQRKEENELLEERKKKEEQMKIDEAERDARKKEHDEIVALSKKDDQESDDETSKSETKTLTKDVPTVKLIGQQHSLYDIESDDDDDDDDDEKVVDVLKLAKRYFITVRISMFMKTLRILLDLFNVSFSCNKDVTPDELIDVMMSGDIMWNSPKDTDKKANVPDWFSEIISSQCVQMRIQKTISLKIRQKMWTTIKQHTKQMQSINDVGRDFYERRFRDQILSSFACQVVRVLVERCLFIGKSLNREISQEFISHFVHDFFQIRRDDFARNCRSINESINVSPFLQNYKDACSSLEMYFKTFDEKKGQNLYIFSIFANP
jgi:chemotaxis protein histidine kinase CheA